MTGEALNRLIIAVISTIVLLIVFVLSKAEIGEASVLTRIDAPVQDYLIRLRNAQIDQPISDEVTVLAIDNETIERLGRFGQGAWKTREPFINQLYYFEKYAPSVVAYDIQFKDDKGERAEDLSADKFVETVGAQELSQFAQELIAGRQVKGTEGNTRLLQLADLTAIKGFEHLSTSFDEITYSENPTTFIFAYAEAKASSKGSRANDSAKWQLKDIIGDGDSEDDGYLIPYLRDVRIPLEHTSNLPADYVFSEQRPNLPTKALLDSGLLGYIHVPRDPDGVVRRYPLVWGIQYSFDDPRTRLRVTRQFLVPSIALLACMQHLGISIYDNNFDQDYGPPGKPYVEVDFGNAVILRPPGKEEYRIPCDEKGNMVIDFVGRLEDLPNLPFWSVADDGEETRVKSRLQDNIVFVGVAESGGADIGPTPVDSYTAWVLVHATVASNILTRTFIRSVDEKQALMIFMLLWVLMTPGAMFLRPRLFMYVVATSIAVYLCLVFASLASHSYVMPLAAPLAYLLFASMGTIIYRYITEEKEKQRIRGMFSTMVSSDVMRYMEDHPQSFSLAGERREATMFFSDVAGFTTISESLEPQQLANLLNEYLSPMTEIIMNRNGYVDKYEGDAIMAEWGVPFPNPDHAKEGCLSALEQQELLAELRPRFKQDYDVEVNVRMGINSGVVSAGNMGSTRRFQYTVMGDAVNQAARYEPTNKVYDTLIIMGDSTFQLAKDVIVARMLDKIIVKGKTEPIQIYELIARAGKATDKQLEVLDFYDQGLKLHWERQWQEAIAKFQKGLAIIPNDGPCRTMIERVEGYIIEPPPDGWLGEYVRTSKD